MKMDEVRKLLEPYKKYLERPDCKDALFMIHFSADDGKWFGLDDGLDALDVGIVINQLFARVSDYMHRHAEEIPPFIHYGIAKDIRDKCDDILKGIEDAI